MKPQRLLVISSGFPSEDGSVTLSVFVKHQVDVLSQYLAEVVVVAPYPYNNSLTARLTNMPPSRLLRDYSYRNVRVLFPRYIDAPSSALDALRGRRWHSLVKRAVRRGDLHFDVIHAHFSYPSGYVARLLSKETSTPYCVTIHENAAWFNTELRADNPRLIKTWQDASCLFTVNQQAQAQLSRFNPNVICVGNGYPEDVFRVQARDVVRDRLSLDRDRTMLLSVADYSERKNQRLIIESLAKLRRTDVDAYLIGRDRGSLKALRKLRDSLDLKSRVHFVGPVPNFSLADYFAASDLFVLASRSESFGVVQVEAMACGLPVVATATVGSCEVIKSDEVGLLVRMPATPGEFAAVIDAALSKDWDHQLIAATAAEQYSMRSVAERLLDSYERLTL